MNKIIVIAIALLLLGGAGLFHFNKQSAKKTDTTTEVKQEKKTYWTCPMHPEVHMEHPGECPICHMKLIQVSQADENESSQKQESRSDSVQVSTSQLELMGVQKVQVEQMDLISHIPIAGRFLSQATVAFQVYESDLRYIKPGLSFTGESSFAPDKEIRGEIISVDSIVDPTSRTVRVLGQIKDGAKSILAETTFRGDIELKLKNVIGIPESSVLHTGRGDLVYMIHEGGHLMPMPVKLGLKTESYYEVLVGLDTGDYISSGPNFLIDSEAKIRGAGANGHSHH